MELDGPQPSVPPKSQPVLVPAAETETDLELEVKEPLDLIDNFFFCITEDVSKSMFRIFTRWTTETKTLQLINYKSLILSKLSPCEEKW